MSEKGTLAKIVVRRFIPDSKIVLDSGLDYTTEFSPFKPIAVYQDEGAVDPISLSFTWSGGVVSFTANSAIDNNIYIDYPLYFSTSKAYSLHDDPVDETGPIVGWEPRLSSNFSVKQSVTDQIEGILSAAPSGISLINDDYKLNAYFSKYDNVKNAPAEFYAVIGSSIRRLGSGIVSAYRAGKTISLSLKANVKTLSQSATLGNSKKYTTVNSDDWNLLDPNDNGLVIQNCFGVLSAVPEYSVFVDSSSGNRDAAINTADPNIGKCFNDGGVMNTGLVNDPFPKNFYVPSTYDSTIPDPDIVGDYYFWYNVGSYVKYFFPGVYIEGKIAGGSYVAYGRCVAVDYDNQLIAIASNSAGPPINPTQEIYIPPAWFFDENGKGFSSSDISATNRVIQFETSDNGQTLVKLASGSGSWPAEYNWFYVLNNQTEVGHSSFIQTLLESVGYSVNATEFATAQTENDCNAFITIGQSGKIESITELAQKVANSVNGILYYNDQNKEFGYRIINESLSGVDFTIDSTDILEPDLVPRQQYQDTFSELVLRNPAIKGSSYTSESSAVVESSRSKVFNRETKIKNVDHYVNDVTSSAIFKSSNGNTPKIFYSFSLKSDYFYNLQIGNIIKINNVDGRLINLDSEVNVIVTELEKSSEIIKVVGYDFTKIP